MSDIHSTAIIGDKVALGTGNIIGPHVIIEDGVKLGDNNTLMAGAYLCEGTTLGNDNIVHMRSVIGHMPQDLAFEGKPTFTTIGNGNTIREFVTIHRGTKPGTTTALGNNNFLMAYSHVAHNCQVGNNIIMVNQASLTGHCIIEDNVLLSGMTGLHQFTRVGTLALLSALSAVNKDIPPYMVAGGRPAVVQGINVIGLRRAGVSQEIRSEIKRAYKLLYRSGLNVTQALQEIKSTCGSNEVAHLVSFIEASERGIMAGSKSDGNAESLKASRNSS